MDTKHAGTEAAVDAISSIVYANMEDVVFHLRVEEPGNFRFQFVNSAFERATSLAPDKVLGRLVQDVIPEPSLGIVLRYYEDAIRTRATVRWEEETPYPNGTRIGAVSVTPVFDADGRCTDLIGTVHDITELRRRQDEVQASNFALRQLGDQLERRAHYDLLTGLPNRTLFRSRLDAAMARPSAAHGVALMFINLDRFKEINDVHGHQTGDAVLQQVARRLGDALAPGDELARLGGDEFTVIVAAGTDAAALAAKAYACQQALARPFEHGGRRIALSSSAGVAVYPTDAASAEELMSHADQAMRDAKGAGLNQMRLYEQAMQTAALERLAMIADLQRAVHDGQLELYLQPIVDMQSQRIVKAEALVRWHRPGAGMVMPLDFIPLAEETGIIHALGNWVFAQAAQLCSRWSAQLGHTFAMCINKSPVQFRAHMHSMDWIGYLDQLGLPHDAITVEITEGVLLDLSTVVLEKLHVLRRGGLQVSIDDFGTGYSSMSYLKQLDVDFLKIDKSFVAEVLHDQTTRIITETIIYMAHKLNIAVVAEGVETAEQHAWLVAQGCNFGQGYHYARPLPVDQFEALLLAQAGQAVPAHVS